MFRREKPWNLPVKLLLLVLLELVPLLVPLTAEAVPPLLAAAAAALAACLSLNCFNRFLDNSTLNVIPFTVELSNAATAWNADSIPALSHVK